MGRASNMTARVVALGLVGLLVASGAPAYADRWSHADRRGDVAKLSFTSQFGVKPAPRDVTTDITRVTVSHRAHRVVIRLRVRDLRQAESRSLVAVIKTPTRRHLVLVESLELAFVAKRARGCEGLRKRFDYAADVITVGVPRHCLGRPAWIRVGVVMTTSVGSFLDERLSLHLDDALSGRLAGLDGRPKFSPRIRH